MELWLADRQVKICPQTLTHLSINELIVFSQTNNLCLDTAASLKIGLCLIADLHKCQSDCAERRRCLTLV